MRRYGIRVKYMLPVLLTMALLCRVGFAVQVLEPGTTGETVTVLTRRLCELGYMTEYIADYNDDVTSAVGDFQTANGLERNGIADVTTQQLLYSERATTRSAYIAAFISKHAGVSYKLGDNNKGVYGLQNVLKDLGYYSNTADGVFGEATRQALEAYQRANGLESTGAANVSTVIRLLEGESVRYDDYILSQSSSKGDTGAKVKAVQERLNELGYFAGDSTGSFGENTQRAVAHFQADNGLAETGRVDVVTYEALFSDSAVAAEADSLFSGSEGDSVYSLQQRLTTLGYMIIPPNGKYGRATETAVMLFCAANGYEITAETSQEMMLFMQSDDANGISALSDSMNSIDAAMLSDICNAASAFADNVFISEGDNLFPGFGFIRYLFARKGVAIIEPADILARIGGKVSGGDIKPGDIVALSSGSDAEMTLSFAICVDAGTIAYVSMDTVVVSALSEIDYDEAYVWSVI